MPSAVDWLGGGLHQLGLLNPPADDSAHHLGEVPRPEQHPALPAEGSRATGCCRG